MQAFLISLKAEEWSQPHTSRLCLYHRPVVEPRRRVTKPYPRPPHQAGETGHRLRFITQGSIEEKILHLQESKRKLAETFITDSGTLPELTNEEWAELLK